MKIYIASSWKNQHAVEMLTDLLRQRGHAVVSFVEKAIHDEGRSEIRFDVEKWIASKEADEKFSYDTGGATTSDLVIYIGPAGTDAWAEVGAAYGAGVMIAGLWAKGEPAGLMRKMVDWFHDYRTLLKSIDETELLNSMSDETILAVLNRGECPDCGGRKTWFSKKQWEIVTKISEKIL